MPTLSTQQATEQGASTGVVATVSLNSNNPSNGQMRIEAYRRYGYVINASNGGYVSRRREWFVKITLIPSGHVYSESTDIASDAQDIIGVFRSWLYSEIEGGLLSVEHARQYADLYIYTDHDTNPSFRYQFDAMLNALPVTESSAEVDALIAQMLAIGLLAGDID
jgi:hypothetical protein